MHIYIDESGTFVRSRDKAGVSLVGALVIPAGRLANVTRKYVRIRTRLPKERGEVKGRLLNEAQIAEVVELLRKNETLLELVAVDMNLHESCDAGEHKTGLARAMTNGLTSAHHPNIHAHATTLAGKITNLSDPLYVQSVVMFELVSNTIEHAVNYYSQRRPEELSEFYWTIDAKDKTRTNWEALWSVVVMPILQSRSSRHPHGFFEGGDYTHFKRFERPIPEWLPQPETPSEKTGTDIRLLLTEHFRYSPQSEPGLELVDILVNATRRALVGNLALAGWQGIPSLMIHRRGGQYIQLSSLHERQIDATPPYKNIILRYFSRGGRSMLAPRFDD